MSPIVVGKLCEKIKVIAFSESARFNMSLWYLKLHLSILLYFRITKQVSVLELGTVVQNDNL
jgi:hypothetical protein